MWSTPSSIARRRTARAASGSRGGPKTPGPASCIAPKPMRLTGLSPRNEVVVMAHTLRYRRAPDKRGIDPGTRTTTHAPRRARRVPAPPPRAHDARERRPAGRTAAGARRACAARRSRSWPGSGSPGTRGSSRAATSRRRRASSTRSRGCSTSTRPSTPTCSTSPASRSRPPRTTRPRRPRSCARSSRRSSPNPAYLIGPRTDVLVWNAAADAHARRAAARARRRPEPAVVDVHRPEPARADMGRHRAQHARALPRRARPPLRRPGLPPR